MKTQSGIKYRLGQVNPVLTLICRATDGQRFEIELSECGKECTCCFPFGSETEDREITDEEINEVLNDWNA